jgi:hypothetical protein
LGWAGALGKTLSEKPLLKWLNENINWEVFRPIDDI